MESPLFAKVLETKPAAVPLLDALRRHPRNVLLAMGARVAENGYYYFVTVFVLSYGTTALDYPRAILLNGVVFGAFVHLIVTPLFGALSDRVGRRPVYLGGAIFLGVFAYPFFLLLQTGSTTAAWLAITLGLVGHAAMYGPQAAFLSELFGTRVRYTGASLGYQLAAPFAGGLAPLVATALLLWSDGHPWPVVLYLIAMAAVTVVSVLLAAETRHRDLAELEGH
jgi:MFS family permease